MSWTSTSLSQDLIRLGLSHGDTVLVHSSYKSLGPDGGEPADVVRSLLDAVGPNGNVMFPAHTWVGANAENPPSFHPLKPSARVGIIPECGRCWPGATRSIHPTHSVSAIGPDSRWLTEGHYDGGICGIGSPYDRLCQQPNGTGKILLLGVDHERNTSLHMVEELLDIPGALNGYADCLVTGWDGDERMRRTQFHTWKERRFMVIDGDLDRLGIQTKGLVAQAICRLVDAARLREYVSQRLTEDPNLFWVD